MTNTSADYAVHTIDSAPADSRAALQGLERSIGMIPNLAASMAESPELLRGFVAIRDLLNAGTFTPTEVQVLSLTNAYENGCTYCMALHSTLALGLGLDPQEVERLRRGSPPRDSKLGALSDFSRALVRRRGNVGPRELAPLLAAGYSRRQALEVVLGVAVSILPNFAHHLTGCPVDPAFAAQRWPAPEQLPAA